MLGSLNNLVLFVSKSKLLCDLKRGFILSDTKSWSTAIMFDLKT